MDFHTLTRRDLQSLCKKNRIPANLTNIAMADALQSLQTVEGIEEVLESLQFSSPKKSQLVSPLRPRTSRRTSSRRVVATTKDDETKEEQASPLPRARRVTVRASEVLSLVEGAEEEEEEEQGEKKKKQGRLPETPMVYTRRSASKKEGEVEATAANKSVTTRRRATAKKEETEIKNTQGSTVGVTTRRRATRRSSKKEVEEVTASVRTTRRSTRGKATVKMAALGTNEEEEEEEEGKIEEKKETEDVNDQKNELCSEEAAAEIIKEEVAEIELNSSENSQLVEEEIAGNIQDEEDQKEETVNEALSGLQDSPVLGLISSEPSLKDDSLSAESTTEEVTEDGGFHVQEIPAENENSHIQSQLISDNCGLTSKTMEEVMESGNDDDDLLVTAETIADTTEITTESNESAILADDIEVEEAFKNQKLQLPEPNLTVASLNEVGEKLDSGIQLPNLEISVPSDQIIGETIQITVESDEFTNNLSYRILAGEVEVVQVIESQKSPMPECDLTRESSTAVREVLDNDIQLPNFELSIPSDQIMGETVKITEESDKSTNNLSYSILAGEVEVVQVIESQKSPMLECDLTGESSTAVGEVLNNDIQLPNFELSIPSDQIMGETVKITEESDKSTNSLSYSILAGEVEVEEIQSQKSSMLEHDLTGESSIGVGEMLDNGIQSPSLEIMGETNEPTNTLSSSVLLTGEILVDEILESQKSPSPEPDLSIEIATGNKEPLEMIGSGVDREENEEVGNKENTEVVVAAPNGGGKKEVKLDDLSLRKLKAAFKEKLVISKKKEEKRSAL